MRTFCFAALLLSAASLAFGQLESDTVTIQASRSINLQTSQHDQVIFSIVVDSPLNASLDDVLAALQGIGISMANLSNVFTTGVDQAPLEWRFTLAAPIAKWAATVSSLAALQQSLATNKSGMRLSIGVQSLQSSSASNQACSASDLIADAQAQAQKVAAVAGLFVGQIVAISDASSGTFARVSMPNRTATIADFVLGNPYASPSCVAEVKFKLLRYQ